MILAFTIPGQPRGMPRHRTTRTGHTYTPKWATEYKAKVALAAKVALRGQTIPDAPLVVYIAAYFDAPKRKPKRVVLPGKYTWSECVLWETLSHDAKPDADNVAKIILDAVLPRDERVADLHVHKRFSNRPRVQVEIKWKDEGASR